ncbi:MAG: class I SAM-dependent DNA methyltransferase [Paracoccaceae bacterium]
MNRKFLDEVYKLKNSDETIGFYKDWSNSYDQELFINGYITPLRCAKALETVNASKDEKIMDIGCGTGLSGEAFKKLGFTNIDGSDFSNEMLQIAKSKNIYSNLILSNNKNPLNFKGVYSNSAAVGVFSPLHAMPDMVSRILKVAKIGGFFVFSLNDHALENPGYKQAITDLVDNRNAEIVFEEYGDHLPKIKLNALIFVLKRLR